MWAVHTDLWYCQGGGGRKRITDKAEEMKTKEVIWIVEKVGTDESKEVEWLA